MRVGQVDAGQPQPLAVQPLHPAEVAVVDGVQNVISHLGVLGVELLQTRQIRRPPEGVRVRLGQVLGQGVVVGASLAAV